MTLVISRSAQQRDQHDGWRCRRYIHGNRQESCLSCTYRRLTVSHHNIATRDANAGYDHTQHSKQAQQEVFITLQCQLIQNTQVQYHSAHLAFASPSQHATHIHRHGHIMCYTHDKVGKYSDLPAKSRRQGSKSSSRVTTSP